ncbi:NAD-dependent epimerase/dehydratase [Natronococcus amylolyticus DSM 10524]|uniref:NAD-dependent epimerase/dehydratase n=1 Tax=Natronococcus amylolyticus DSM 10524 TaxID=1227497 RepID=L9WZQ0_9EURY|nr:NAD-dependent epimerase/dehydratase [Natronococcus amylolyticus DSM 10524]
MTGHSPHRGVAESSRTPTPEQPTSHSHADISTANALLGDEPTRDIREGVREFIDWDQATREWDEPLVRQS